MDQRDFGNGAVRSLGEEGREAQDCFGRLLEDD